MWRQDMFFRCSGVVDMSILLILRGDKRNELAETRMYDKLTQWHWVSVAFLGDRVTEQQVFQPLLWPATWMHTCQKPLESNLSVNYKTMNMGSFPTSHIAPLLTQLLHSLLGAHWSFSWDLIPSTLQDQRSTLKESEPATQAGRVSENWSRNWLPHSRLGTTSWVVGTVQDHILEAWVFSPECWQNENIRTEGKGTKFLR